SHGRALPTRAPRRDRRGLSPRAPCRRDRGDRAVTPILGAAQAAALSLPCAAWAGGPTASVLLRRPRVRVRHRARDDPAPPPARPRRPPPLAHVPRAAALQPARLVRVRAGPLRRGRSPGAPAPLSHGARWARGEPRARHGGGHGDAR